MNKKEPHTYPTGTPIGTNRGTDMSFIAWLFLGLIAGVASSRVVNRNGQGVVLDVLLGVGGAIIFGLAYNAARGAIVLNLYSLPVAVAGSVSFLLIYHLTFRRP
jgi:uncharacterized membrane protein YeaQ/YmgE (transglycosylase-associated protein family)